MIFFKKIKWFFQRGRYGWADCDSWDLKSHFARMMVKAIRDIKKGVGCPSNFYNPTLKNDECKKWHDTLEEMAQGFEAVIFLDNFGYHKWVPGEHGGKQLEIDYEAQENARKKMERGLELFAKHYMNLWD